MDNYDDGDSVKDSVKNGDPYDNYENPDIIKSFTLLRMLMVVRIIVKPRLVGL